LPYERAQCAECPNSFELIPPADASYKIPKEKPTSDDYIKRVYECEEGHRNTIYWEKEPTIMASVGKNGVDVKQT